ncbi:MAG: TrkH family potassium uptake protein [Eubacterium sp.]|nr:TrkH family potassium uptake protein [Eubacterium sp.]
MNHSIIIYILGYILRIEGALLMLPVVIDLIHGEGVWPVYLICGAATFLIGMLLTLRKPKSNVFYLKEGCVSTALSWIALSIFGGLPFILTGEIPNFINATFEVVSGLTTTGASILTDIESLSHASIFWRSFTHWIGGMGVLVFLMAILPMTGGSSIHLMRAESPGPDVGKLAPHMRETARILYLIYMGLTASMIILLLCTKMPIFDAFTMAFGTAGTGGFAVRNSGLADYTIVQQNIITVFMILFGVNFNAFYYILYRKFKKAWQMEEVRAYLLIIFGAIAMITINILNMCSGFWDALQKAAFQVGSIITTTGFSNTDFDQWPAFSKNILVILMFCGACAGSTGGGFKVSRVIMLIKSVGKEITTYIHPKTIRKIKFDGSPLPQETVRSTAAYFLAYVALFILSVFLVSLDGHDFETNFTGVAATFNNIGPGLGGVGPTRNFDFFSPFSKIVMIFDMLAGRLELFPMLILLYPKIWIEDITHHHHHAHNHNNYHHHHKQHRIDPPAKSKKNKG